jgi:hypothetical protein
VWQRVNNTAIDSKQRIELKGRVDAFSLGKQFKSFRVARKVKHPFLRNDFKCVQHIIWQHLVVGDAGVNTGVMNGGHVPQPGNLIDSYRFRRHQIFYYLSCGKLHGLSFKGY